MAFEASEAANGRALIDGVWRDAQGGQTYEVINPATGGVIARAAFCGRTEAENAVAAAHRALPEWRDRPASERAEILRTWASLLLKNKKALGELLTKEQGKPLAEAEAEIAYGASYVSWFAEQAVRVNGRTIPASSTDRRQICIKQPVGVVACITPWNFPNAMLARKIAPALASGCTVVCKPDNQTPLSALALGALALEAGAPAGVVNIVSGETEAIGYALTSDPRVRKLTFTGSTEVGKMLVARCASTMKRTSMELGGNAPFIVFDDADIEAAVTGLTASKFRNAGQTCICANRILVQRGVMREFVDGFVSATQKLRIGDGTDVGVDIGPLINVQAAQKVRRIIDDAKAKGAQVVFEGDAGALGPGYAAPVILTGVNREMSAFKEEIFGPAAPIIGFDTEEEAVNLANETPYGLAAYVYARDIGRIWRTSERLECGMVGVNESAISNASIPFGGVKESGHGREGSVDGLDDYLDLKYICLGGLDR